MFKNEIGDDFHYHFICNDPITSQSRMSYMPLYFNRNPNVYKFEQLFSTKNKMKLIKLCRFIKNIIERVSSPG